MDARTWVVAILGGITLAGVFLKMQRGFGPFNLRAVGIVFVGTIAALLGGAIRRL